MRPRGAVSGRRGASRRRWWLAGGTLIVLGVIAYLAVTALMARHDIQQIQGDLGPLESDLKSGNISAARPLIETVQRDAAAAHSTTTGPVWWLASSVPWVGSPLAVLRDGSDIVNQVAQGALPAIATASEDLNPTQLRHGHTLHLAAFTQAEPSLLVARSAMDAARAKLARLPSSTWLPAATTSRDLVVTKVNELADAVDGLARASGALPRMLGADGVRRYLFVFENDAESRGLGGIPGAYAVLQANHGRLRFIRFGSDVDLEGSVAPANVLPSGPRELYQPLGMTNTIQNATLSPDFPTDARVLQRMVGGKLGLHFNGVFAADPTALSYLLAATGPVTTKSGITLTDQNLVSEVEANAYAQFHSQTARKSFLVDAAHAAADNLLTAHASTSALIRGLQRAAAERRLVAYSDDPSIEQWLAATSLGGALPATSRPFSMVAVDNSSAGKLDYYLDRSLNYRRTTCLAGETETTIVLRNDVPRTPLPEYVSGHARNPNQPVGFDQLLVFFYATSGSRLDAVSVNGHPVQFTSGSEAGHPVAEIELDMLPRKTYDVSLYAHEPPAQGEPLLLSQPLVRGEVVSAETPNCAG